MDKEIEKIFSRYIPKVDREIKKILSLDVSRRIRPLLNYPIGAGGKRIRPILAILSGKLVGGGEKNILPAAAGIEILHNYSLIIDDIIDKSILRRGEPTLWKKYGKSVAECLSIDYAASIFQAALLTKEPKEISEIFSRAMKVITEGEILDILFEQKGREDENFVRENRYKKVSLREYMKMVRKKTAYLLRVSCEIGGILGGGSKREIKALGDYGENLGISFQVRDDILDIFGKRTSFGKEIGRDIKDRKLGNIVFNFAFENLSSKDKREIQSVLRKDEIKRDDVRKVILLIKKTDAEKEAERIETNYAERAKRSLNVFRNSKWKGTLLKIADFVIEREK